MVKSLKKTSLSCVVVWKLAPRDGNLCQDYYSDTYYNESPSVNPTGPDQTYWRVMRGGSWVYFASLCQVSSRSMCMPGERFHDIGLRLAL